MVRQRGGESLLSLATLAFWRGYPPCCRRLRRMPYFASSGACCRAALPCLLPPRSRGAELCIGMCIAVIAATRILRGLGSRPKGAANRSRSRNHDEQ